MLPDSPKLLTSLLHGKCPRCRKGDVFTYPLNRVLKFSKTNVNCPHCDLRFESEPGFYYGAMYISYAFSTGLLLIAAILYVFYDFSVYTIMLFSPIVVLLLLPFMFRYSRLILLYVIAPKTHNFDPRYWE